MDPDAEPIANPAGQERHRRHASVGSPPGQVGLRCLLARRSVAMGVFCSRCERTNKWCARYWSYWA